MTRLRQVTQIELGQRELLALCAGTPQVLSCLSGELWVTFDGRAEDLVVGAGECIELDGRPGVVLSGLQASRLSLTSTVGRRLQSGPSLATAVRRLRWHFPVLASFPARQLR